MTGKQMVKLYEQNGWIIRRITKHYIMEKNGITYPVPFHTTELKKKTEAKLLKKLKEVG